jgi:hypothetical protein
MPGARHNLIQPAFVLQEFIHPRPVGSRPLDMPGCARTGIVMQLESAAHLDRCHINTRCAELPMVFNSQVGINDVIGLLASDQAFFDERQQYPVLFSGTLEKCTNVPMLAERCTRKMTGFL